MIRPNNLSMFPQTYFDELDQLWALGGGFV